MKGVFLATPWMTFLPFQTILYDRTKWSETACLPSSDDYPYFLLSVP